jgi:hypothetical protein
VGNEEGFDFAAQRWIGAGAFEVGAPLIGRPFEGASENVFYFLPAFRRHVRFRLISVPRAGVRARRGGSC